MNVFDKMINAAAEAFTNAPRQYQSIAQHSLGDMIRKKHDFFGASHISNRLLDLFKEAGGSIGELMEASTQHDQKKVMRGLLGKDLFIIEHAKSVKQVRDEIISGVRSEDADNGGRVWVLVEEDKELTRMFGLTDKGKCWESAYAEAGIDFTSFKELKDDAVEIKIAELEAQILKLKQQ